MQRFEKALARDNDVHNSGGGFLQVPLTNLKELYGIKFKHPHESEAFYRKILNEMGKKHLVFVRVVPEDSERKSLYSGTACATSDQCTSNDVPLAALCEKSWVVEN